MRVLHAGLHRILILFWATHSKQGPEKHENKPKHPEKDPAEDLADQITSICIRIPTSHNPFPPLRFHERVLECVRDGTALPHRSQKVDLYVRKSREPVITMKLGREVGNRASNMLYAPMPLGNKKQDKGTKLSVLSVGRCEVAGLQIAVIL